MKAEGGHWQFSLREAFTVNYCICGAHMVYGWRPTALDLYPRVVGCNRVLDLLTKAKVVGCLSDDELAKPVNNPPVGASKLLYFANPGRFYIWDSRIYRFLFYATRSSSPRQRGKNLSELPCSVASAA